MRGATLAALLLAACAPEAEPPREKQAEAPAPKPAAGPAATEPTPPEPKRAAASPAGERRCGWLSNPTPANWWLTDRDGQWILATQGGEQVEGMDDMPDMSTAGWVETNGHYGYGCACMTVTLDPATRRVVRVADAAPRPLEQCRADKALKSPD